MTTALDSDDDDGNDDDGDGGENKIKNERFHGRYILHHENRNDNIHVCDNWVVKYTFNMEHKQAEFHDAYILHHSDENRSKKRRCAFIARSYI